MSADTKDDSEDGVNELEPMDPEEAAQDLPDVETSLGKASIVVGLVMGGLGIYYLLRRPVALTRYTNQFLGLAFTLFLLVELSEEEHPCEWSRSKLLLGSGFVLVVLGGILSTVYVEAFYRTLAYERIAIYPFRDKFVGATLIVATIVATKRAYGWLVAGVTIIMVLFARYGPLFPSLLNHGGLTWDRIITLNTVQLSSGVYHIIVGIGATWIFIFLVWAGIIERLGGIEHFIDLGFLIGGRFESGIAQSAVVSSMLMGSISGSPMANIAVTGSFTIPLMKSRGIRKDIAGAIEAVASTGGMILPPVMGSVAFLMASFLPFNYADIIVIAALPALLYYVATALSVHLIVSKTEFDPTIERDIDGRELFVQLAPIAVSVVGLFYFLLIMRLPPGVGGAYTIGVLVVAEFVKRLLVRDDLRTVVQSTVKDILYGVYSGGVRMAPLAVVLAAMGIIISSFNITGTGYRLSLSIVSVAGGNLVVLLLLVMVSAIVLGMGMPTVAAYLVTITLVAPAMTQVGFATVTSHFFVFYFAMLAALTPPIALSATVASQVADAEFIDVAKQSVKIGIPLFLLPYVFAFNESLMLIDGMNTVITFAVVLVGYILLVFSLHTDRQVATNLLNGRVVFDTGFRALRGVVFAIGVAVIFAPSQLL